MNNSQKIKTTIVYVLSYIILNGFITVWSLKIGLSEMDAMAAGLATTLAVILLYHRRNREKIFYFQNLSWKNIGFVIGIWILSHVTTELLSSVLPSVTIVNQESIESYVATSSVLGSFLSVVILGPIVEEIVFRRLFITVLFSKMQWLGIIISACLFAWLHSGTTVTEFVVYGIPGLTFGYIYYKFGIEYSIMCHMLVNGLALVVIMMK